MHLENSSIRPVVNGWKKSFRAYLSAIRPKGEGRKERHTHS